VPFILCVTSRCGLCHWCCAGLSHGYNGRQLFRDVDLDIEQGERVAIIGPNG
jgi:ATPase subunit of ABC transporter with duplicated ATPase domains